MKLQDREVQKTSWLDCVSYKAGIPKWLLGSVLFITVASVIYLCFSCCCEAESEKVSVVVCWRYNRICTVIDMAVSKNHHGFSPVGMAT